MNISRILSGAIALVGLAISILRYNSQFVFSYCFINLLLLLLIWVPDAVNDYTIGAWVDGYKIEDSTPPLIIGGFGWVALVLVDAYLLGLL